jgi:EAL domain-containing protein (putative c-di-GMP-specific phosphodiesterase class I)/GGDEF domain-containing protein
VLRVVYALNVLGWPIVTLLSGPARARWPLLAVAVAVAAIVWAWLLHVREISSVVCQVLGALGLALVDVLIVAERGGILSIGFAAFFIPVVIADALFMQPRSVAGHVVLGAIGLVLTAVWSGTTSAGTLALSVVTVVGAIAALTTVILVRGNRRAGMIDPDTGLMNGHGFAIRFDESPHPERFLLAVVRLEGIGDAREAFGHRVAIELLRRSVEHVGQVLPSDALIARLDGDELVVALGIANPVVVGDAVVAARELARTLAGSIELGRFTVSGIDISLRPHVGLAVYPDDGVEIADLVRRASLGAQRAAKLRKPELLLDSSPKSLSRTDLALLSDLSTAAVKGELALAYQPQVDSWSGAVVAVEALLRWQSAPRGSVSPGEFIPLAERSGLIDRLTDWVFAEALDAQVRWRSRGLDIPVSVNLSARALTLPDIAGWILDEITRRGLPAHSLTVEVTETSEAADLLEAISTLQPLHDAGIHISIDDFGTGYTSLSVLPELPLSELKLDQRFVVRALTSPADDAIARTVRELAHRLGLRAIAEGVDSAELYQLMVDMGYDVLQGFYISRPLTEEALLQFVSLADLEQARSKEGARSARLGEA